MPIYRIFKMGNDGKISEPAQAIDCADEQDAIRTASQAVDGKAAELWDGARFIIRFPRDDPK
jgi:hypothetical protein